MTDCATCALVKGRDSGTAPVWDNIYRTPYWDIAHAYPTSLRGWLVIVCRRHIAAIDELTEEEAQDIAAIDELTEEEGDAPACIHDRARLIRHTSLAISRATAKRSHSVMQQRLQTGLTT